MPVMSIDLEDHSGGIQVAIRLRTELNTLNATATFSFEWTHQDQEDLRWYLEDYLTYPVDPAPAIAARVEKKIATSGTKLFSALFQGNSDSRRIWESAAVQLPDLRVEL